MRIAKFIDDDEVGSGEMGLELEQTPLMQPSTVLAGTCSYRQLLGERSGFGIWRRQSAIIFSVVIGIALRNV